MSAIKPSRFGLLLRRHRLAAGWTQEELAERAGMSAQGISNLERGIRLPYRHTVDQLADGLQLTDEERVRFVDAGCRVGTADLAASAPPVPPAASAPHSVLVGRARELGILRRHLHGAGPPVLLFAGEPGIGKTRLLQVAEADARGSGVTVVAGGCQRWSSQEPYAPLLEALERVIQQGDPGSMRATLQHCSWLVRLLPELTDLLPESLPSNGLAPEQERRLVFRAVHRFLAEVGRTGGTLLVLDDLQWAGSDALELLSTLVRPGSLGHEQSVSLRVVGAYRDTDVAALSPLHTLLADLAHAGLVEQVALSGLSNEEATSLLARMLDDRMPLAGSIVSRAGGVPFFLVSCAQSVRAGTVDAENPDTVPWDLTQSLLQRIAVLPEDAGAVLRLAATAGGTAGLHLLVMGSDLAEAQVAGALDVLRRARLLEEAGDGYRFVHDVIQEVVLADMGPAGRAVLHRRLARALEGDQSVPPEVLAHHYVRGEMHDNAVQYLEQAGDRALGQYAYGTAESHYRGVLERLESQNRESETARVREKLGVVLHRTGRFDEALTLLDQAVRIHQAGSDLESVARTTARIARVHGNRGTPAEGIARITALLDRVEAEDPSLPREVLYEELTWLLCMTGQYEESLAVSGRLVDLIRTREGDGAGTHAELHRVNVLQMAGRVREAMQVGEMVLPVIEARDDLSSLLLLHRDLAYISTLQGNFTTNQRYIERALAVAERLGDPAQVAFTRGMRGWFALLRGEWRSARADVEQALALSRQIEGSWFVAYALFFLAHQSLVEGDTTAARTAAEEAICLSEARGDLQVIRPASAVLAELDLLEGRPNVGTTRLLPLLDRSGLQECDVTTLLPVLAWTLLEQDDVDGASEVVTQAVIRARRQEMRLVLVDALRIAGMVAQRREHVQEVVDNLEEGLALARAMPYPYAVARLRSLAGTVHHARGEALQAREQLEEALTLFRRLGARNDVARTEQELVILGRPQMPTSV